MSHLQILVRCTSCGYTVAKDSNILQYINKLDKFRCKQCRHLGATIFITQDWEGPNTFIDQHQQSQQKESLLSEMTELSQRKETLQALIIKHSSKKEELQAEVGELNQQASELAQRKTELEASVEQLSGEVAKLEQSRQEAEEIENLKKRIQELEEMPKGFEKEEQEAVRRLSQINQLITRKIQVEQQISNHERRLSTEKRTYQKIAQEISKNQTELEELQSKPPFTRGAGWQDEEKRLEQAINQLNEQKAKKREEIVNLKQNMVSIRRQRENIEQEILELA